MSSIKTIENPDAFRENIRAKLLAFFPPECEPKHANNLEKGIHNWSLKEATNRRVVKKWDNPFFVQIYLDHLRSIFANLKNDVLIAQIVSGEIKSQTVAFMTHQEMQPEKWQELIRLKCIRDKSNLKHKLKHVLTPLRAANVNLKNVALCRLKRVQLMKESLHTCSAWIADADGNVKTILFQI
jgi:hypothetical protein